MRHSLKKVIGNPQYPLPNAHLEIRIDAHWLRSNRVISHFLSSVLPHLKFLFFCANPAALTPAPNHNFRVLISLLERGNLNFRVLEFLLERESRNIHALVWTQPGISGFE